MVVFYMYIGKKSLVVFIVFKFMRYLFYKRVEVGMFFKRVIVWENVLGIIFI